MPNVPCPVSSPCVDPANPLTNYSTEAADQDFFFRFSYPIVDPNNPVGGDPGPNQPPNVWQADGCEGVCTSTISQFFADLCAALQSFQCTHSGQTIFLNNRQACRSFCPDGSPFTFVIAAGLVAGTSQDGADAQALAIACANLQKFMICLPVIATEACANQNFTATITPSRGIGPFTFFLDSGALPPGLSFQSVSSNTIAIVGTPTIGGSYTFAIRVVDRFGDFMVKSYTLCIVDISPSSLPDATINAAYSQKLTATACANQTQSWQVVAGSLPAGLTLDEQTGIISGTPTGPAGSVLFRVRFQDSST